MNLGDHHSPLVLSGDFTLYLFDMEFQVTNGTGETTTYDATFGGARGDDIPSPLHEYHDTRAELHFTNATFTLLPAGRPLQVNLRSVDVEASGGVYLTDAKGTLQTSGLEIPLAGSLVEMDAEDLRLTLSAERESPPLYGVDFSGLVRSAAVDGRPLDLAASEEDTSQEDDSNVPAGFAPTPGPAAGLGWLAWAFILLPTTVMTTGASWWWIRSGRFDLDAALDGAKTAMDDGHTTRAKRLLDRILRHDPINAVATLMTARLLLRNNRRQEAMEFLEPRVDGPADQHGTVSLAYSTALQDAGRIKEAREVFEKARRKNPEIGSMGRTILPPDDDLTYI